MIAVAMRDEHIADRARIQSKLVEACEEIRGVWFAPSIDQDDAIRRANRPDDDLLAPDQVQVVEYPRGFGWRRSGAGQRRLDLLGRHREVLCSRAPLRPGSFRGCGDVVAGAGRL